VFFEWWIQSTCGVFSLLYFHVESQDWRCHHIGWLSWEYFLIATRDLTRLILWLGWSEFSYLRFSWLDDSSIVHFCCLGEFLWIFDRL
jgi:hypothetical protein